MNLHPDDNPLAAAFREKLQAKRGGAHFEIGRFARSASGSPDPLLDEDGFTAPAEWTVLPVAEAIVCVAGLLARAPSSAGPELSRADAEAFAVQFGALVSGQALFYSFDSGVLFVDGDRMGRLWVEDDE